MRFWKTAAVAAICTLLVACLSTGTLAVELSLAGIKLGRPATDVLKKFGNPTRITVSTSGGGASAGQTAQTAPGAPAIGGGPVGLGPMGALGGIYPGFGIEPGATPGLPGMELPGMPLSAAPGAMQMMPGAQSGAPQEQQATHTEQQVTWTYDMPNATTIEFILSESGHVVQITVGGAQPYALSKTSKGIKLGNMYKEVIFKYGYPESQYYAGRYLRASYKDAQRCEFTFLGKYVVGITIALKT